MMWCSKMIWNISLWTTRPKYTPARPCFQLLDNESNCNKVLTHIKDKLQYNYWKWSCIWHFPTRGQLQQRFTNSFFCPKVLWAAFLYLQYVFEFLAKENWQKNLYLIAGEIHNRPSFLNHLGSRPFYRGSEHLKTSKEVSWKTELWCI